MMKPNAKFLTGVTIAIILGLFATTSISYAANAATTHSTTLVFKYGMMGRWMPASHFMIKVMIGNQWQSKYTNSAGSVTFSGPANYQAQFSTYDTRGYMCYNGMFKFPASGSNHYVFYMMNW